MTAQAGRLTHAHIGGFALLRHPLAARHRGRPAASPTLARGERILATEPLIGRHATTSPVAPSPATPSPATGLVATNHALYRRGADEVWRRIAWEDAMRVSWDPRRGSLYVAPLTGEPVTVTLPVGSPLGTLVRERVASTLLGSRRVAAGTARATVVIRRRPGTSEPVWQVYLAPGVDPDDPVLAEALTNAIRRLRSEFCL